MNKLLIILLCTSSLAFAERNKISKPDKPTYFIAYGPDGTRHVGVTETNQTTVSGQPSFISDTNIVELLNKAYKLDCSKIKKVQKAGEKMEKGFHSSKGKLVYCTEGHVIIKADIEKDGKIKKSDKAETAQ